MTITANPSAAISWSRLPAGSPEEVALHRRLLEVLFAPAAPGRLTYDDFLAWATKTPRPPGNCGYSIGLCPSSNGSRALYQCRLASRCWQWEARRTKRGDNVRHPFPVDAVLLILAAAGMADLAGRWVA